MAIACKYCGRYISNRDYKDTWERMLGKGWTREEFRACSPSCAICAARLKKDPNGNESPDHRR